jgi:hypothetical protein
MARSIDSRSAFSSFFALKSREGAVLEEVLRPLERALRLLQLVLIELRDAEGEPVVAVAAAGDDLGEDLLRLGVARVLDELLGVDPAAHQVVAVLLPVLLEAAEEILEADGDGATLVVLHLDGGAVEAEELPDLLRLERHRAVHDLLLDRRAVGAEGDEHHRVGRDAVRERLDRREDGGAAGERDPGAGVLRARVGVGSVRGGRLSHGVCVPCFWLGEGPGT